MERKTTTVHMTVGDGSGRQRNSVHTISYSSEAERRVKIERIKEREKKEYRRSK